MYCVIMVYGLLLKKKKQAASWTLDFKKVRKKSKTVHGFEALLDFKC